MKGVEFIHIMENEVQKRLVDFDTGQVYEIKEGDIFSILSKEQRQIIKKKYEKMDVNENMRGYNKELGGFIFLLFKYSDLLLERYDEIDPQDITKLFYLATYVNYEGYLMYDNTNKVMSKKSLMNKIGVTRSKFDTFFKKMVDLGILTYKNKKIRVNNELFFKGSMDEVIKSRKDYTRMYIDSIRYLYNNVHKKSHKRLGNYFKIIPYIHRQENVLCWNPDSHVSNMKTMVLRDLKNILNYEYSSAKEFIRKLFDLKLKEGNHIMGFFHRSINFWDSIIIINPKVVYGGDFMGNKDMSFEENKQRLLKYFEIN